MKFQSIVFATLLAVPAFGQTFSSAPLANPAGAGSLQPNWSVAPDGAAVFSWIEPARTARSRCGMRFGAEALGRRPSPWPRTASSSTIRRKCPKCWRYPTGIGWRIGWKRRQAGIRRRVCLCLLLHGRQDLDHTAPGASQSQSGAAWPGFDDREPGRRRIHLLAGGAERRR